MLSDNESARLQQPIDKYAENNKVFAICAIG
jgi:hypothetical protein